MPPPPLPSGFSLFLLPLYLNQSLTLSLSQHTAYSTQHAACERDEDKNEMRRRNEDDTGDTDTIHDTHELDTIPVQ